MHWHLGLIARRLRVWGGDQGLVHRMRNGQVKIGHIDALVDGLNGRRGGFLGVVLPRL